MDPSPQLVLLTTSKINKFLKNQNQTESYISEFWVYNALKSHISDSFEIGLVLSDSEISDRVTTIAAKKIMANIATSQRFMGWQTHPLSRLNVNENINLSLEGAYRERSEITDRGPRREKAGYMELPHRGININ